MDTSKVDEAKGVATAATAPVNDECLPTRNSLSSQSELSDCGYVTQLENQESTSSNEDDKRYHRRPPPTNQKQRFNAVNNPRKSVTLCEQDIRRKKLVKRRNGM